MRGIIDFTEKAMDLHNSDDNDQKIKRNLKIQKCKNTLNQTCRSSTIVICLFPLTVKFKQIARLKLSCGDRH